MSPPSWALADGAPLRARLAAAHSDAEGRRERRRAAWKRAEAPAMEAQMAAMEQTIVLLERELKTASASLAKAEAAERRGGISSGMSTVETEMMLGVLEDKLMRTQLELEDA